ncbi:EspA/EspE family type VII secretion system effector [Mycobacterium sp. LTG2003]
MGLLSDVADFGKDVVDDREKWADRFKKVGDFIERNAKGDKLERVATAGRKLADFSRKFTDFFESRLGKRLVKAAKSPILAAGQHVIDGMKLTTGLGDPENGGRFGQGAERLGDAGQKLTAAFPSADWDSSGSDTYTGRNNEQVSRTQTMIGADQLVAAVLSREAQQIAITRDNLDSQSDWLGDMSLITMATGCIPYVGKAAQIAAEVAMVSKAVGESTNQLMSMQDNASANAAEVRSAVSQYEAIADAAKPTGGDGEFEPTEDETRPEADTEVEAAEWSGVPRAGSPTGGGGGTSAGGGGGPAPQQASMRATPSMPAGMPAGAGAVPAPGATGGDVAGLFGAVLGSVMGPLGGLLGGVMQAAGQAAQVATQAATQAAQVASQAAGQAQDPAALAETDDKRDKKSEGDREGKEETSDGEDQRREPVRTDAEAEAEKPDEAGQGGNTAGESEEGAAKTLPPDLAEASAESTGAGPAPVHIGADFEQSQLRMPAAATLERGIPGSASAINT